MMDIWDSVTNVSGTITDIVYHSIVVLYMLYQRAIPSIPIDVLEKVTPGFKNSSILDINHVICNKRKKCSTTIFTSQVGFDGGIHICSSNSLGNHHKDSFIVITKNWTSMRETINKFFQHVS